jgi:hypothetical protein
MPDKQQQQKINVELRPEEAEGIYANFAVITHSAAEFVIDFIRVLPGAQKSRVHARIVMAPQNVKAFVRALEENVKKFESQHGEIKTPGKSDATKQIGFQ